MNTTLMLMMCFFGFAAWAQTSDEKDIATTVEFLRKAMIDGDRASLEKITAPELSYGHSNGKLEDKSAFVEAFVSGKSDFVTITLTDQTIRIIGTTALVRHTLTGETNDSGKPGSVKLGVLLVWQKQNGEWKLIGRQAYKLPQ
ncbi:nuclear transport factor 2 family protein [Ohtaekwangia koreensis]|nr:nuclear transport factor 2 family protein [Ohtaekwangia koreensis]